MEFATSREISFFSFFIEFNYPKATKSQSGDSLLFTNKSPRVSVTHLIDLGRMEG